MDWTITCVGDVYVIHTDRFSDAVIMTASLNKAYQTAVGLEYYSSSSSCVSTEIQEGEEVFCPTKWGKRGIY